MTTRTIVVVHGVDGHGEVPGLAAIADAAELRATQTAEQLRAALPGAEVLLNWNFRAGELEQSWDAADALRWIQWGGAGVDAGLFPKLAQSDVVLTNMRGIFDRAMAEYTLGMILAVVKELHETRRAQAEKRWAYRLVDRLDTKHALIVGVGSIGRETARLLRAAGMQVSGVGRRARATDPDFGVVHAVTDLDALLPQADFVVLIAPLTDETRGMFGAAQFESMHDGAWLVNIGRGALVDESAMIAALERGSLAGAALDVFATEPLPETSPLWTMDNVFVSPHMSGDYHGHHANMADVFIENFRRFRAGEPLLHVVDKQLGFVPA